MVFSLVERTHSFLTLFILFLFIYYIDCFLQALFLKYQYYMIV